jgi:response regulator RpfG family c-di-GMP phosphodiesterase
MNDTVDSISRKVLFVDDEVLLLEGIKRQLRRELDITTAEGAAAALSILYSEGPFAVVVSDYNMPGMDGIAFLSEVYRLYPHTVLMMLTGRAELDVAVNALHTGHVSRFLNKPCPKEILLETMTDGLEQYRLRMSEQLLQKQIQQANQQLNLLNNHLESLVEEKTRALQLQYRYVADLAQMQNSHSIIEAFVAAVETLTTVKDICLWLSPQLDGRFSCFYPEDRQTIVDVAASKGVLANTIINKKRWILPESTEIPNVEEIELFCGQPYLCQPLLGKKGGVGLLNLSGNDLQLDKDTLEALTGMTDVTATALQSHWHREAFDDAQDAIITALAKLSEYRDPETGAHLLRLKKYSALLCQHLAETDKYRGVVTPEFSQDLVRSSPLHDIGKVGIPDAILKKPGRLTEEEFHIMKNHASIGGDTLRSVYEQYPSQGFIKCGMDIAYGHHEKWDGSGYPLGLQGEAIPLAARVLALVDVYDALTCRRIYKEPFSREQANELIFNGKASHFDPYIVEAFIEHEAEFYQIAEQYADHF